MWSDLWLNEGHATFYDALFAEQNGFIEDFYDVASFEDLMHLTFSQGDEYREAFGPVGQPRLEAFLSPNAYEGGALVLFALRQQIGARAFRQLERERARRFSGESVTTADFIALAPEVSGQDLTGFVAEWVYGTTTPPVPGFPDWQQGVPPGPPAPAAAGGRGRGHDLLRR